jgi:lysozyme
MQPMARRGATWVVVATTLIGTWEGMSLVAYPDRLAGNIPTVCAGVTRSEIPDLKAGDRYTRSECDAIVAKALPVYDAGIRKCIKVPMSQDLEGMTVSLAYNIGIRAVCKSTFVKKVNERDPNACDYMLWFDKASGKYVQGLANRRADEHRYCVRGLTAAPAEPVIIPTPVPEVKPVPVTAPTFWQRIKHIFGGA